MSIDGIAMPSKVFNLYIALYMNGVTAKGITVSDIQKSILKTLSYFDIFDYPLNLDELYEYAYHAGLSKKDFQISLQELVAQHILVFSENLYHFQSKKNVVEIRKDLNQRAAEFLPYAKKYSQLISKFPFVEAVFITGSLSKNCMPKDGDVDYFIVAKPGRLWVCRLCLTAFKKIFLLNSRKYFCVNYYLDSASLKVPDSNIFTATEIVFAIPVYNERLCTQFYKTNEWTKEFYQNKPQPETQVENGNTNFLKNISEKIFSGSLGETLDELSFKLFVWRWKKKFSWMTADMFDVNLRSSKTTSKHHQLGFQFKVLKAYEERIQLLEKKLGTSLS